MEKHIELSCLIDYYGTLLTDRQRALMEQYVCEDCSLAEIAEREGISRQGVRDALKRGEEQLYALEDKLGLMRRETALLHKAEELATLAQSIRCTEAERAALAGAIGGLKDLIEG